MNPDPTPPPVGQLLVKRGVLTAAQLEHVLSLQNGSDRSLTEIIVEHGLAEPHALEAILGRASLENNVIAFESATRGGPQRGEEDAEWRRRLFDLAGANDDPVDSPSEPRKPRGVRRKLVRNLEAYLARTAADLDERGEVLQRRSNALAQELQQLATAEAAVERRAGRLREHDLADEHTAGRVDELLELVKEREARIGAMENERQGLRQQLELAQAGLEQAQAEAAERKEALAAQEERVAALVAEVEAVKTNWELAERNLAERDEMLAGLERANETETKDLEEARSSLTRALAESADTQDQLRSSEVQREALSEELERLRERLHAAEANLAERGETLATLEAANEAQLVDLGAAREALDERTARISGLERDLEEVGSAMSAARLTIQSLQSENADLASLHEQREAEMVNRAAALHDVEARLVEREQHASELLEKLEGYERELEALQATEAAQKAALAKVVAESADRDNLLLASEGRVRTLTEELEALRTVQAATVAPQDEARSAAVDVHEETTYLCFGPLAGSYALVERCGPLPRPGDEMSGPEYGGRRYLVSQVGRSPLPLDERMCVYLLALE